MLTATRFQYLDNYDLLIPQKDQFFRYDGDGVFTDVSAATGIAALPYRVGRGVAFGDYDSDGDVDMFIVNNHGPAVLLRNEGGNRNNWLHVKLIGKKATVMPSGQGFGSKWEIEYSYAKSTPVQAIYPSTA